MLLPVCERRFLAEASFAVFSVRLGGLSSAATAGHAVASVSLSSSSEGAMAIKLGHRITQLSFKDEISYIIVWCSLRKSDEDCFRARFGLRKNHRLSGKNDLTVGQH